MSLLALAGTNSATGGYNIDNSLKFEADNTEYLTRTPSSAGNEKTWTWSGWVKYTEPTLSPQTVFAGGTDSGSYGALNFRIDAGQLELNTASVGLRTATQKFRDPSAWYHFVVAMDTTQSTADDRIKIYVNGSQITDFSVINNPPQNTDMGVNANELQTISRRSNANDRYFAGYMAELHLIDGTALTPTDFGEFDEDSGIWKPKAYTGSYGTNGYYLDFESSGSLGADSSGNGNNFTLNNITSADQATDTPTNNFCIMSPLWKYATSSTLTNGGTYISTTTAGWTGAKGSIGIQNGKWYWEVKSTNVSWSLFPAGIQTDGEDNISSGNAHSQNTTMALGTGSTYIKYVSGVESSVSTGGVSMTTNNITGVALDLDSATKTLKWFRNNTLVGTVNIETVSASFGNQPVFPFSSIYADSGTVFIEYNFGGYTTFSISSAATDANGYGTFEYAPPSGYYALCTKNLEEFG
jgi:hypothetical protein